MWGVSMGHQPTETRGNSLITGGRSQGGRRKGPRRQEKRAKEAGEKEPRRQEKTSLGGMKKGLTRPRYSVPISGV